MMKSADRPRISYPRQIVSVQWVRFPVNKVLSPTTFLACSLRGGQSVMHLESSTTTHLWSVHHEYPLNSIHPAAASGSHRVSRMGWHNRRPNRHLDRGQLEPVCRPDELERHGADEQFSARLRLRGRRR